MYWAETKNGDRVYVDESIINEEYFCPHCKGLLIRKWGSVTAHHFAHRPQADCDPWYNNHPGKGSWHKSMQEQFPKECQEVKIIADNDNSLWHIADVFVERKNRNNVVIEFQHSTISWESFKERTLFYRQNHCNYIGGKKQYNSVVWVFDCLEKNLYIRDVDEEPGCVKAKWPGRDRIRFLGDFLPDWKNKIYIIFHAIKNRYIEELRESYYGSYIAPVFLYDLDRKDIFANVMAEENEYRLFEAEEIDKGEIVEYIIKYL